jgi:hypothetical protein
MEHELTNEDIERAIELLSKESRKPSPPPLFFRYCKKHNRICIFKNVTGELCETDKRLSAINGNL